MELKDKVVLVTGSSQGIGKETAIAFSKEGANIVITYNVNKEKAKEVFNECNKIKESFLVHLDVTDQESIKNCVESVIDKFGAINILINNAGVISWEKFSKQNETIIEDQININLFGLIKMTKAVLPFIQEQEEAVIINISSGAGKQAYGGLSVYCATKFGVRGFTQALAQELPKNIRIYSVNPGMTATAMKNHQGIPASKVAKIIVNAAKGKIKVDSTRDVDVWKFV